MYKNKLDKILQNIQKPARYIGGEAGSVIKDKNKVDVRFAFCFPDTYDIGMSHLGMKILYALINKVNNYWCERVFMPLPDMEEAMLDNGILLYGLESLEPIKNFDFIGFTLQYELTYTNVLCMLGLAGIPVLADERDSTHPIIIAGGPCVCNPEPLCDFIDIFVLGEGEEVSLELMRLYEDCKKHGLEKKEFFEKAAQIEGIYVPSLYDVIYNDNEDGTVKEIIKNHENAPSVIKKRIIEDFNKVFYPDDFVVPFCEIVHDRAVVEVLRGCIRGCRFCQAGFIYRPFREKSENVIMAETKSLCENTGYDEVSLSSLSTSDYHDIEGLLKNLTQYTDESSIGLSLPSLRIDKFNEEVLEQIKSVRKSGLTFAPEAGTQRLRDVINKNITDEDILKGCRIAFEGGYTNVKLYFMLGLPTETLEDIEGIKILAEKIIDLFYSLPNRKKGKPLSISISLSTFIPKPFTPFEFEPQLSKEEIEKRQKHLLSIVKNRKINISWSDYKTTLLEAALARGDRRLGKVIYEAFKRGCKLDGWDEYYKYSEWLEAFKLYSVDTAFYANRTRSYSEVMPWSHLDMLVTRDYLIQENKLAHQNITTPNCREKCSACGVNNRCNIKKDNNVNAIYNNSIINENNIVNIVKGNESFSKSIRLFFSKAGRAKYISHLDLNRTMQRAMKRSGIPVWETEGFNKHIYLTFALPLSLGIESYCESMDIKVTKDLSFDDIKEKLNSVLPEGLKIINAAEPVFKHTAIKKAEYEIESDIDVSCFKSFLEQEKIITKKKTKKKGVSEIDLKPYIEFALKNNKIVLTLPAGVDLNINPTLVIEAYKNRTPLTTHSSSTFERTLTPCYNDYTGEKVDCFNIVRTGIFMENGDVFK